VEALGKFHLEEEGQGLVEYAPILVLVAVAVVAELTVFGSALSGLFSKFVNSWP
jgi:Flp pilus assembly pilin Flp